MDENRAQHERGDDIIAGRNSVNEALRSGRTIDSLYVARGNRTGAISALIAKAKEKGIAIKEADGKKLDFMCGNANHQGVVAVAAVKEYATIDDIFRLAEERNEQPFIIIADELEDPHNLGAILRTAECAGAHGVIVPRRRSVGYVPVARVTNMVSAIEDLKERGVWIYSADMDGENWCAVDYKGPLAVVIGSEGFGVSRLVKEKSDFIISLPMKGKINSLNASVACGILCYEIARQRGGIQAR